MKITIIATLMIFLAYFLVLYGGVVVHAFVSACGRNYATQLLCRSDQKYENASYPALVDIHQKPDGKRFSFLRV